MTSTRAGSTPANSARGPSSRRRERSVCSVEGFRGDDDREVEEEGEAAVMRVLMTQIGFVISTVALPANAPASIDSMVESFCDSRPARLEKTARVHSYPVRFCPVLVIFLFQHFFGE